jgi:hypothetical protein
MAILQTINNGTAGTVVSDEQLIDMYVDFEGAVADSLECLNRGITMVNDLNIAQEAMECIKDNPKGSMAAMESFLNCRIDADGRLVSMEGDDAERTLVQKIKDWFKQLWNRFQDFFMKFSLFAQAASRKLGVMAQKLTSNAANWKAEKLKGNEAKCFSKDQLDKDLAIDDADKLDIVGGKSTLDDIAKKDLKPAVALDDNLKQTDALALINAYKKKLDDIVSSKQKINGKLKAAMDSIKVSQNGADRKDRAAVYRQARMNYHVALKNVHTISSLVVRSANKLLNACAKAYKGGMKEALS